MKSLTKKQLEYELAQHKTVLAEILTMGFNSLEKTCARVEEMAKDKERTSEQQIIYDYNINYVVAVNNMLHPAWDIIYQRGIIEINEPFIQYLKAQRAQAIKMKIVPDKCACTYCTVNS